jgi:hypothetical protein
MEYSKKEKTGVIVRNVDLERDNQEESRIELIGLEKNKGM